MSDQEPTKLPRVGRSELGGDKQDAERYRWLRDSGHLNIWWSVDGPNNRCENIDADIDEAMKEPPNATNNEPER